MISVRQVVITAISKICVIITTTMKLKSSTKVNGLPVVDMIYGEKKFEAFFLRTWLTEGGMLKTILR